MKTTIYIATQMLRAFPSDACYRPIFLGGTREEGFMDDMSGESISGRNPFYSELTAQYWIWKNDAESDIVGLCHYRRFLWLKNSPWWLRRKSFPSIAACDTLLKTDNVETWLAKNDAILPHPDAFRDDSLADQFKRYIGEGAYKLMEDAVRSVSPEYLETFEKVLARRWGYFTNIIIAKREFFADYCAWLFPVLFHIEDHMDKRDVRNHRVLGHCSERLLNVFVAHRKPRVKELPQIFIAAPGDELSQSSGVDLRYLKRRYIPWWVEFSDKLCGKQ